ncbi:MAG: thioredoxin-dependent thiol peroxidase [Bacteroidota bacterium]
MAKKTVKKPVKKVKTAKKAVKKVAKKTVKKANKAVSKKVVKKVAKKIVKKTTKKLSKNSTKSVKKAPIKTVAKAVKKVSASTKKKTNQSKPKATTSKFVAHSTSLKVGDKAPFFSGVDQNGKHISLSDLAGKTIILYFYPKDDTPGCTATACSLRDEYPYLSNKNYAVVGVSADDEKSHAKFASKYSLPFPLIADTNKTVMKAYDVWGTKMFMGRIFDGVIRTTFVINGNGVIENVIKNVDTANHAKQILAN